MRLSSVIIIIIIAGKIIRVCILCMVNDCMVNDCKKQYISNRHRTPKSTDESSSIRVEDWSIVILKKEPRDTGFWIVDQFSILAKCA